MALGTQLQTIVEMVRDEARLSSATSKGIDHLAYIKRVIKHHYTILADGYDWTHLSVKRKDAKADLSANQQFYNFPANLNLDRPFKAFRCLGGVWEGLSQGIGPDQYNEVDSWNGGRGDPLRIDFYSTSQFEVWPVPGSVSAGDIIGFDGSRVPNSLTADNSTADIDDLLLSLHAAAEILDANNQERAARTKIAAANARLSQLKAARSVKSRVAIGLGEVGAGARLPRNITHVRSA